MNFVFVVLKYNQTLIKKDINRKALSIRLLVREIEKQCYAQQRSEQQPPLANRLNRFVIIKHIFGGIFAFGIDVQIFVQFCSKVLISCCWKIFLG